MSTVRLIARLVVTSLFCGFHIVVRIVGVGLRSLGLVHAGTEGVAKDAVDSCVSACGRCQFRVDFRTTS